MSNDESASVIDLDSKFWRTTLLLISVLLVFAGPTYVPYVLSSVLNVNYIASIVVGGILLLLGLLLLWFLIRKKVIV